MSQDKPQKLVPFRRKEDQPEAKRQWLRHPLTAGVLAAAITLFFLSPHLRTSIPVYQAGQIASADVTVPVDLTVEDRQTSQKRRDEALAQVLTVFDYDPSEYTRLTKALRDGFQYARQAQEAEPEKLRLALSQDFRLTLSMDSVAFLAQSGFSERVEAVLTEVVHQNYGQPVGSARSLSTLLRNQEVVVRNIQTLEERRMLVKDIATEESLQRVIEKSLQQSAQLLPTQRKALAGVASEIIRPNLHLNSFETDERERLAVAAVEPVFYQLKRGRVILRAGDEVTEERMSELAAVREALAAQRSNAGAILGLGVLLTTILFSFWLFLQSFYTGKKTSSETFVIVSLVLAMSVTADKFLYLLANLIAGAAAQPFLQNASNYYYAIPFPLGALLLTLLLDGTVAIIYSLINALVVGLLFGGDFYLVFYSIIGSLAAVFGTTHYKDRSAIYRIGLAIAIVCAFYALILHFVSRALPTPETVLFIIAMAFICALLVAILVSFLLPMFESMFNFITDIKLLELANLNLPILRQLMLEAPGTYHHSILLGSLAEAGAEAIALNPLFLRTAAYYHDIGKVKMAEYFVENQRGENPHERLNASMSALIISNHVKEGLDMAARIRLPRAIADCIPQHHGTRLMSYFFNKAKEKQDARMDTVKEDDYRYPGPKPQSKEAAIIMLADAVEAAARTLEDPSPGKLKNLIKKIVDTIVADGQLDECEMNLKELNLMSAAFLRVLIGIYHRRIDYPGFEFEAKKIKNGKS